MMRNFLHKTGRKKLIALLALIGWLALLLFSSNLTAQQYQGDNAIRIGLLIPGESYKEAAYSARAAVDRFNANGGIDGVMVDLLIREMDGPWGQGTREVVDLVYEEKVFAIVGAHKGRNAHLVEQVIARTQVPFISSWASDPTLSQAFVPWYFSSVPNSRAQAETLVKEISRMGHRRLLLISDGSYDAETDLEHVSEQMLKKHLKDQDRIEYTAKKTSPSEFPSETYDAILLFGEPFTMTGIFSILKEKYGDLPIYASFAMLGEGAFGQFEPNDIKNLFVVGSGTWMDFTDNPWHRQFLNDFERHPGAVGAYTHDAIQLVLDAIKASNANRSLLLDHISKTNYEGFTGRIKFDQRGNRQGIPGMMPVGQFVTSRK